MKVRFSESDLQLPKKASGFGIEVHRPPGYRLAGKNDDLNAAPGQGILLYHNPRGDARILVPLLR